MTTWRTRGPRADERPSSSAPAGGRGGRTRTLAAACATLAGALSLLPAGSALAEVCTTAPGRVAVEATRTSRVLAFTGAGIIPLLALGVALLLLGTGVGLVARRSRREGRSSALLLVLAAGVAAFSLAGPHPAQASPAAACTPVQVKPFTTTRPAPGQVPQAPTVGGSTTAPAGTTERAAVATTGGSTTGGSTTGGSTTGGSTTGGSTTGGSTTGSGSPPVALPEVSLAPLLPLGGLAVLGIGVVLGAGLARRREG